MTTNQIQYDKNYTKDFYTNGYLYGALEKDTSICGNYSSLVSTLCERLGGGGHFTSAAATFMKSDVKEVENMLINVISLYLKDAKIEASRANKEAID